MGRPVNHSIQAGAASFDCALKFTKHAARDITGPAGPKKKNPVTSISPQRFRKYDDA